MVKSGKFVEELVSLMNVFNFIVLFTISLGGHGAEGNAETDERNDGYPG